MARTGSCARRCSSCSRSNGRVRTRAPRGRRIPASRGLNVLEVYQALPLAYDNAAEATYRKALETDGIPGPVKVRIGAQLQALKRGPAGSGQP